MSMPNMCQNALIYHFRCLFQSALTGKEKIENKRKGVEFKVS